MADSSRRSIREAALKDAEWRRIVDEKDAGRAREMIVQLEGERWFALNYVIVEKVMVVRDDLRAVFSRAKKDK